MKKVWIQLSSIRFLKRIPQNQQSNQIHRFMFQFTKPQKPYFGRCQNFWLNQNHKISTPQQQFFFSYCRQVLQNFKNFSNSTLNDRKFFSLTLISHISPNTHKSDIVLNLSQVLICEKKLNLRTSQNHVYFVLSIIKVSVYIFSS